jgi:hypothetical protein
MEAGVAFTGRNSALNISRAGFTNSKELIIIPKKLACTGRNIFLNVSIACIFINSIECAVEMNY